MNTRKKGYLLEHEFTKLMQEKLLNFKRVTLSGQLQGLKGDFVWLLQGKRFRGEAKSGKAVPKRIYDWLEKDSCDFLVVRRDRKGWLLLISPKLLDVIFPD